MSAKVFVDTNVLIYFYTKTEKLQFDILEKLLSDNHLVISTQVLNELSNVLLKELSQWCFVYTIELKTIIHALGIVQKYKISYFDSLMIAAALECDCSTIYSEDMNHGCLMEASLRNLNPFKHNLSISA